MIVRILLRKFIFISFICSVSNIYADFYSIPLNKSLTPEKFSIILPSNGNTYSSQVDPKFGISSSDKAQNVILQKNQTLYIDTALFNAQVTSEIQHTNKVIFIKNGANSFTLGYDQKFFAKYLSFPGIHYPSYSSNADLGHELNYLKLIEFNSDASVAGNATADQIVIDVGKTAFITAGVPDYSQSKVYIGSRQGETTYITANDIILKGKDSTLTTGYERAYPAATLINANIITNIPGTGQVLGYQFLSLNQVGTSSAPINNIIAIDGVHFKDNVYANNLSLERLLKVENGININSNLLCKNIVLNLSQIQYDSNVTTLPNSQISISYRGQAIFNENLEIRTSVYNNNIGNIIIDGANSNIDLSAANNPTITLFPNNTAILSETRGSKYYPVFRFTNGGFMQPYIFNLNVVNEINRYVVWSYDSSTYSIVLKNNFTNLISDLNNARADDETLAFAQSLISQSSLTGQAYDVLNVAAQMSSSNAAKTFENAIPELSAVADESDQANAKADEDVMQRLSQLTLSFNNKYSSKSSGDDLVNYGFWFSPFYGTAKQQKIAAHDAYRTYNYGGTIGFDSLFNDDKTTLGIALSYINSRIKPKNDNLQDKGKLNTYVTSLYGKQDLTNNIFAQGIVSYGYTRVKNTEERGASASSAKFNISDYGFEMMSGYNIKLSQNSLLIPMLGARYDYYKSSKYRENGNSIFNLSISKKSHSRTEAILGSKIQGNYDYQQTNIMPELGVFVNYNFNTKGGAVTARLDGLNFVLPDRGHKLNRFSVDLNAGLGVTKNRMEYGIFYNCEIEKKYVSHQAMLKVKINI